MSLKKVSVIGIGMVGSAICYTLTQASLFQEIVLIDINKNRSEGEALDMTHAAALTRPKIIKSGDYKDTCSSDIVIITAGIPQKPGETRLELIDKNVVIFKDIIDQIVRHSPNSIILVVSNPVDILSWVTYKLSGFPENRVLGTGTVLDTSRFRYHLGNIFNIDPRNVHGVVLGEHGDSEFINWSEVFIGPIKLKDYAKQMKFDLEKIKPEVECEVINSASEIINKKGYTNYGIAMATRKICETIIRNEKSILPISSYDSKNDIYYSLPSILGNHGKIKTVMPKLDKDEKENLKKTINILKKAKKGIDI